ncbi:hypothetical protein [Parendozoicomonas haliclonae]|uniref:Uncharacterized protein n=1 Tax=Parendozoicomonas haliclonae TaxID=1960125 RepID=A0A1X7AL30_9GAMM|nr:hypothetical protein [Parendozoicomonas haliclonae]SMA48458.1 hypothetical protein EHSB41UT_02747 [Parendozoicomonas haliclonae]
MISLIKKGYATALSVLVCTLVYGVVSCYPLVVMAGGTPELKRATQRGSSSAPPAQGIQQGGSSRRVSLDARVQAGGLNRLEQKIDEDLASFIDGMPYDRQQVFIDMLQSPKNALLLMMAAKNPVFAETLQAYMEIPDELQESYQKFRNETSAAFQQIPKAYKSSFNSHDVSDLPLSAGLVESVQKGISQNNIYWVYFFLSLLGWGGAGLAAAFQPALLPAIGGSDAIATVYETNMRPVCRLVGESFQIEGPLRSLRLSSNRLLQSTCVSGAIAAIPGVTENIFMPLVMTGVLTGLKAYLAYQEHHGRRQLEDSSLENLGDLVERVEAQLQGDLETTKTLIKSQETAHLLDTIAQRPSLLLPVGAAFSRMKPDEFNKVSQAVMAVSASVGDPDLPDSAWGNYVERVLDIKPHIKGVNPRTSGILNALYNVFKDRKTASIYGPLITGFALVFMLHTGIPLAFGVVAPYMQVIGNSTATIIPTSNLTQVCAGLNFTVPGPVGAEIVGEVVDVAGSTLGGVLTALTANTVTLFIRAMYSPCQWILSSPSLKRAASGCFGWLRYLCCRGKRPNREQDDSDELTDILIQEKATLLNPQQQGTPPGTPAPASFGSSSDDESAV